MYNGDTNQNGDRPLRWLEVDSGMTRYGCASQHSLSNKHGGLSILVVGRY